MLRQTKKPAMIALSFGVFRPSSRRPARRDSKLPIAFSRDLSDAGIVMHTIGWQRAQ